MKMIIGGVKTDASNGKVLDAMNPATGGRIDSFPDATKEDVDRALAFAQEGKKIWAATPLRERAEILRRFSDLLEEHQEEMARLLCTEMGRDITLSRGELSACVDITRSYIEYGKHLETTYHKDINSACLGDMAIEIREPLGVVVCIVPFNFPVELLTRKSMSALMMGNAVIIKPSSEVTLTLIRYAELLLEAGVPGCVAQIVTGAGSTMGSYLVDNDMIDCVAFTGSTEVGIQLAQYGAKYLHHVLLELGGNDPLIIFDDADLNAAVEGAMSRVSNVGQTCCTTKRFLVHNSVREEFTSLLIERLKKVKMGDPQLDETEMGCCINEKAAMRIEEQVQKTVEQGAVLLYGGKREGAFYQPCVLGGVTRDMDIAKDMEVFGPVFPIIGFDTEEEAIEIANQTTYGLNGGVMSADMVRSLRVASKIQAGTVVANGPGQWARADAPFGGYKKSGLGREGLKFTLEEMSQVKNLVIKGIQ